MSASRREESSILNWFWYLVSAPSRVVMLNSPHPPGEVLRRLRKEEKVVQMQKSSQIAVRVPIKNSQRRFIAIVESDTKNGTRLIGRMETPYRIALFRLTACLFLFGTAIVWLQVGRIWLGVIFVIGGIGFLLSSQYERLWGRDLRLHLEWLRRLLDAEQHS
jgi:hypothetical protein